ncbi:hypothetical protein CFP65_6255 [Kitasatospora sp. MMS16-BH015]|uniref:hypothetical protein n=1 Tax=Kitasatospora sp. MMS16-BH015 TaxID=2018025 RepID=UPI000CA33871|nr:hypothetical protein [Kitasatospora sp. MMS16-BH015]AUG80919.1 hypothetical protein CFP65_6255 [Kitasatospora sp. MMS16-BH015]
MHNSLPLPAGPDDPFAGLGELLLAVRDHRRGLLAAAGSDGYGLFRVTDRARRRWLLHAEHPVNALAFHPSLPLLAVGTGEYDGGYLFEGELLLVDLATGAARSLFEDHFGRQVLGLEWPDDHGLRVLLAPPDDWKDSKAHREGHLAVIHRTDWATVPAGSLTGTDLAGPRVPAPRPDHREAARRTVARLLSPPTRRHHTGG